MLAHDSRLVHSPPRLIGWFVAQTKLMHILHDLNHMKWSLEFQQLTIVSVAILIYYALVPYHEDLEYNLLNVLTTVVSLFCRSMPANSWLHTVTNSTPWSAQASSWHWSRMSCVSAVHGST